MKTVSSVTESEMEVRNALYETSEDISSALLWLAGGGDLAMSLASASDRIRGAIECLRRHQVDRVKVNEKTTEIMKSKG